MIWANLNFEDIMVLNNVTKFHRVIIKTIHLREQIYVVSTDDFS